jgi:hypothetical protein
MLRNLLRHWRKAGTKLCLHSSARRAAGTRHWLRPLEALERRLVPAVPGASLDAAGVLRVQGGDGADVITLDRSATNVLVTLNGGLAQKFAISKVTEIKVYAGACGDTINLLSNGVKVGLYGEDGADSINVGSSDKLDTIEGLVIVNGGLDTETDTLSLNDQGNRADSAYTLTGTTLRRSSTTEVWYYHIDRLRLNAGSGANEIYVQSTGDDTNTTVNAGNGGSKIYVGSSPTKSSSNTLDALLGPLTVNGGNDGKTTSTLYVNDQDNPDGSTYTLTNAKVWRSGQGVVTYSSMDRLYLNAGSGGDVIYVRSTASGTFATIDAGNGNNKVRVGNSYNKLDDIARTLNIHGGGNSDTLDFNDQGNDSYREYMLTQASFRWNDTVMVGFDSIEKLNLNGGGGNDDIFVRSTRAGTTTTGDAGDGNDKIRVGSSDDTLDAIAGSLIVHGGAGYGGASYGGIGTDTIYLYDQGTELGRTYTLTWGSLQRTGIALVQYDTVEELTFKAGDYKDTINVLSTAEKTKTTVDAGKGDDDVYVGDGTISFWTNSLPSLDAIAGTLIVDGSWGDDALTLDDRGHKLSSTYTVRDDKVNREDDITLSITYHRMQALKLRAGSGGNTINVKSTSGDTSTTVEAGNGDDEITVSNASSLDDIAGPVTVNGGPGSNTLSVFDSLDDDGGVYTLTPSTIERTDATGAVSITYSFIQALTVSAGANSDSIYVLGTATETETFVAGAGGDDRIYLGNEDMLATSACYGASGPGCLTISGGAGSDTLDYSMYRGDVLVNLLTGTATGVSAGISGIDNVTGGWGNDILVGDVSDNVLM